ncbi:MAG TPA: HNH endonuclease, partial [Abditibacterium sp.]
MPTESSSSNAATELATNGHQNGHDDIAITSPDELPSGEITSDELTVTGNGHAGWTPGFRAKTSADKALNFPRRNTRAGQDVWETSQWERRTAAITGETGKSVFEQKDCEIPANWSQLATNVVVSKYFRGPIGTPQRETSVKQVIGRVADTIGEWGKRGGYFASDEDAQSFRDELAFYLLHQYGAFNSPVWFNLGVKNSKAQASACFINSVHDDMESIMELAATEARLFKGGSGAGSNLWRIRSSKEQLSGGGAASGPVSFMRGWDSFAGAIKSGGTCLAPYQRVYTEQGPVAVEELARRDEFITLSFDPPANRFKAKRARAWLAGQKRVVRIATDKGSFDLSFDHPVKLSSGEYVPAGDLQPGFSLFACSIDAQHGHARVHLRDGQKGKEFWHRLIAADVMGADLKGRVVHHCDGNKENNAPENLQVMTQADHAALHGRELAMAGEHPFQINDYSHAGETNGMHRDSQFWASPAANDYRATQGQLLTQSGRATEMQREAARQKTLNTAFRILNAGWPIDTFEKYAQGRKVVIGRIASIAQLREQIEEQFGSHEEFVAEVARQNHRVVSVETVGEMDVYDVEVQCPTPDDKSPQTGHNFLIWDGDERIGSGVIVANTRRAAKMVILNADHPDIEEFITCKATEEKKAWALIEAGYNGGWNVPGGAYDSVMFQNANHSVRVGDDFMRAAENNASWNTRAVRDGKVIESKNAREMLLKIAECTHLCGDPGLQYDSTINDWHTCANTDRIYASNPCCVTGDTLVGVADGRNAVAIKELAGSEVPVYAHDHATGKTTISRMWNIGVKRENAPVYRVTLDDGSSFRATDDHLIMLRDGSYRMVRDLKPSDALMPFHSKVLAPEKNRTKRRHVWTGQSWTPQFRAIWNDQNGTQPAGTHIHHADFDALNDAVENLVLMSAEEHNALHVGKMLGDNNPARRGMNDQWRQNISRAVSGENNPNFGRTHSNAAKATMSAKAKARFESSEARELASQRAKTWISDAKAEGRQIGRTPGETFERSCPVCRASFQTQRIEQIFCGSKCRNSPMGYAMSGEKGGQIRARTPQSAENARRAALVGNQHAILRAARALMDNGVTPSLENWAEMRPQLEALGFTRIPLAATVARTFADSAQLQEAAAHFNHKVSSVEFCGHEDVYDGTVDTHHNFAILTSSEDSCADGHQNFSGIFIHNSEFVFLDDTACNLSSLNLLKFYDFETGHFDAASYTHACETFLTAQEIIVSFASYPTAKIAENSELYRPLGLGYCNIGALLMAMGLAYDSDQGRAFAGALTAIMTGAAYRQSAKIARNTGPFEGYAKNREPMLRVIAKHRDAVNGIDKTLVAENVMQEARTVWDDALIQGQKYGYRNAQTTVLAPTGCLVGGSLISTDKGLVRLEKLGNPAGETWQDTDFRVFTDGGTQKATKFFINGLDQTRKITTQAGYTIQGTLKHRVKVVNSASGVWEWKRFADLVAGDLLPLAMNTLIGNAQAVNLPPLGELHWNGEWNTKVPAQMSPELAELVGYFMGDGSLHAKGLRFCVAQGDLDVAERIEKLALELFGLKSHRTAQTGYLEVAVHSVSLALWWDAAGFAKSKPSVEHVGKGYTPRVPEAVLHSNDSQVYGAFLRGLYEADGTNILGVPAVSTAHADFASEVRSLLLALGFPTSTKQDTSAWGGSALHVLRLRNGSYNPRFLSQIGFIGARKTAGVVELKGALSGKRDRVFLPREVWDELVPTSHPVRNAVQIALKRHGGVARQLASQIHAACGDERLAHALGYFFDEVAQNE